MKFTHLGAAIALATAVSASFAQEAPSIVLTLSPIGSGTLANTFQREVSGLFVDTFSFAPSNVAGTASVRFVPGSSEISFFAALLNGEGFSYLPESGQSTFAFQSMVTADMPLSLTVFGYAGNAETLTDSAGNYTGTISVRTIAAIPEPETYALMLAGLGMLSFASRRHRRFSSQ